MPQKRISKKIEIAHINAIGNLLNEIKSDEVKLQNFFEYPIEALNAAGLNFEELNIPPEIRNNIVNDLLILVKRLMNGDLKVSVGIIFGKSSSMAYANSNMTYNWDHNVRSEVDYESYTDTERGAKSSTNSKENTNTEMRFTTRGISTQISRLHDGPLISEENLEIINKNISNQIRLASKSTQF